MEQGGFEINQRPLMSFQMSGMLIQVSICASGRKKVRIFCTWKFAFYLFFLSGPI